MILGEQLTHEAKEGYKVLTDLNDRNKKILSIAYVTIRNVVAARVVKQNIALGDRFLQIEKWRQWIQDEEVKSEFVETYGPVDLVLYRIEAYRHKFTNLDSGMTGGFHFKGNGLRVIRTLLRKAKKHESLFLVG